MPLGNLTAGDPFKVAMRAAAVFLVVYAAASAILVKSVHGALIAELRAQTEAEVILLREIYVNDGQDALTTAMTHLATSSAATERVAGLFDDNGLNLTGPISLAPDFVGIRHIQIETVSQQHVGELYLLNAQKLDTLKLAVGRNLGPVKRAERRLLVGLFLFGLTIALAVLGIGLWASRKSYARLEEMEAALAKVSAGEMDARLPVHARNDQFDRVSERVNQNLDRLSHLVAGVKSTASAIAHDLKTPLSHAQIALHEASDAVESGADLGSKIDAAISEMERLNQIFDTMLRISRIQASTEGKPLERVDLGELAHKIVEFLRPIAEENHQSLTLEAEDVQAEVDAPMLEQALINLIKNALDHAGDSTDILVSVSTTQSCVELTVSDNGQGIPDAEVESVLEPFVRLDSARNSPGSGLGLALVRAVAEHHAGRLDLSNAQPGLRARLLMPKFKKV